MSEEHNCSQCAEKGQTCIPFFVHENAMMHKDMDNERMHETLKEVSRKNTKEHFITCATFILIIIIFVTAYTVRTNIWLGTVNRMNQVISEMATGRAAPGTEVADATVHEQPD